MDCDHCTYKDTIVHYEGGGFCCDSPEGFKCPDGEFQTCAVITIVGNLRDRMNNQTEKEWKRYLKYLTNENKLDWDVRNVSCNIMGW